MTNKIVNVELYSWRQVMIDREHGSNLYNIDTPAQWHRAEALAAKVNPPSLAGEQGTEQETCTPILPHDLYMLCEIGDKIAADEYQTRESVRPY